MAVLVVNVVGELQQKRTLAASRGFLAAARLSCLFNIIFAVFLQTASRYCNHTSLVVLGLCHHCVKFLLPLQGEPF